MAFLKHAWLFAAALLCAGAAHAQSWRSMGPPGGDVRVLAADSANPRRLFLGTADGHIFGSDDAGDHWSLVGRAGNRQDSVVTGIIVGASESRRLLVSTWSQDGTAGGGIFRSDDGGHSWQAAGLAGHAVRAMAAAPSDARVIVAGALDGVYRSNDGGENWERISPENHAELRNLDSVAIDPQDPRTIYAGTFHLPWKTGDGGKTWGAIHQGMIDDSDVMSIAIDRNKNSRILASACSGIYLSDDGALQWRKVQGIPYSARRTLQILQDPVNASTVYAATTEGLWRTMNAGAAWSRLTPGDWVINTVAIVPRESGASRILIGTERFGVLASDDEGKKFRDANTGFNHRQILALALDPEQRGKVLAVLANAPEAIVATSDGGENWSALGPGLSSRALLRVYAAPNGWWASLERGGLMKYNAAKRAWMAGGRFPGGSSGASSESAKENPSKRKISRAGTEASGLRVNDMAFGGDRWYAATERGLFVSTDQGAQWNLLPLGALPTLPVRSVRTSNDGRRLWVVSLRGLVFSRDGGKTWSWHDLALSSGGARWLDADRNVEADVAGSKERAIFAVAENGLYISRDGGANWKLAGAGLPQAPLQDLAIAGDFVAASMRSGGIFVSNDAGKTWERVRGELADGFFPVVIVDERAGKLYAASATDGLYVIDTASGGAKPSRNVPAH
jgi:photosystem II stability/assembly factor-like uncharacterized protein